MTQLRAVIKGRDKPLVEGLLETTGIESASALISVMLSRYSRHLSETWEVVPTQSVTQEPAFSLREPTNTRPDNGDMFI